MPAFSPCFDTWQSILFCVRRRRLSRPLIRTPETGTAFLSVVSTLGRPQVICILENEA